MAQLQKLVALAREHDFVIASDECYSEIYLDESTPPPGLLQACAAPVKKAKFDCLKRAEGPAVYLAQPAGLGRKWNVK